MLAERHAGQIAPGMVIPPEPPAVGVIQHPGTC
jgi:hypothetical protein